MKSIHTCPICKRDFYSNDDQAVICGTMCLGRYKSETGKRWGHEK